MSSDLSDAELFMRIEMQGGRFWRAGDTIEILWFPDEPEDMSAVNEIRRREPKLIHRFIDMSQAPSPLLRVNDRHIPKRLIKRGCPLCRRRAFTAALRKIASGAEVFQAVCCSCGCIPHGEFIKKEALASALRQGFRPAANLGFNLNRHVPHCEVCDSAGAEEHHWAPTHIFGAESDKWPKSMLCPACHKKWHALVTPSMSHAKAS